MEKRHSSKCLKNLPVTTTDAAPIILATITLTRPIGPGYKGEKKNTYSCQTAPAISSEGAQSSPCSWAKGGSESVSRWAARGITASPQSQGSETKYCYKRDSAVKTPPTSLLPQGGRSSMPLVHCVWAAQNAVL